MCWETVAAHFIVIPIRELAFPLLSLRVFVSVSNQGTFGFGVNTFLITGTCLSLMRGNSVL